MISSFYRLVLCILGIIACCHGLTLPLSGGTFRPLWWLTTNYLTSCTFDGISPAPSCTISSRYGVTVGSVSSATSGYINVYVSNGAVQYYIVFSPTITTPCVYGTEQSTVCACNAGFGGSDCSYVYQLSIPPSTTAVRSIWPLSYFPSGSSITAARLSDATGGLVSGQPYAIISAWSTMVLDGNVGAATQLSSSYPRPFMWGMTPSLNFPTNHQWTITSTGDGYYTISSVSAQKCLDGNTDSQVPQVNAPYYPMPFLWNCMSSAYNHHWKLVRVGTDKYAIINRATNLVLDANVNASTQTDSAHRAPFMWSTFGPTSSNHLWTFVNAGSVNGYATAASSSQVNLQATTAGSYSLTLALNSYNLVTIPVSVTSTCSDSCIHGVCNSGGCQCGTVYTGSDCNASYQKFRYLQVENGGMYTAYPRMETTAGTKMWDGKDTGENKMIGGGTGCSSFQRCTVDFTYKSGYITDGDIVHFGVSIQASSRTKMSSVDVQYDSSSTLTVYYHSDGSIGTETIDYYGTGDPC